ncbi:MAG: hypothetical protein ABIG32_01160 [Candidatus Uhrbacteria bacterium]|nr:hypothetical protein [Patescibacteria group bacterium]MBU1906665.1 hypothetical protein [Patescibacteria group bacterium]
MITRINLGDGYAGKIDMREALYEERSPLPVQERYLEELGQHNYRELVDASMQYHLTFGQAFAAACFALRASNAKLDECNFGSLEDFGHDGNAMAGREILSGLAMKEAWGHLTPQEVAGMVTATMMDVMRFPDYGSEVIETCGMGGDRGLLLNGSRPERRKTINCSTLSALVLAALGIKTAKHGSYSNTSAVGSTNAIEKLGAVVDIPDVAVQQQLAASNFHFTDAHAWKTIHDLSHLPPRRETVNHVIGPMTPPVSPATRLHKIIGVNEKLHPSVLAKAFIILNELGVFNVGNVAVVSGLSRVVPIGELDLHHRLRAYIILDELSPAASAVSFVRRGQFAGKHLLTPSQFGVHFSNFTNPFIPNVAEVIHEANLSALRGEVDERQLVELLAMNAALALYLVRSADDDAGLAEHGPSPDALRDCYETCFNALTDGRVYTFLQEHVDLTKQLAVDI